MNGPWLLGEKTYLIFQTILGKIFSRSMGLADCAIGWRSAGCLHRVLLASDGASGFVVLGKLGLAEFGTWLPFFAHHALDVA